MILFRFTFPGKDTCMEPEMYFRDRSDCPHCVEYLEESCQIRMMKNARVSFDTFFNCFSYSRYTKYTHISALHVTLLMQGAFKVRMLTQKHGGILEVLSEKFVDHKQTQKVQIEQPLACLSGEGFLYIELHALSDQSVFSGGHYSCPQSAARAIRLAVIMCAYRHDHYVYRNADALRRYLALRRNRAFRDSVSLIIVDNGRTLDRDKLESDRVKLFYNRNLGGSGGFARGMIEAACCGEGFTHMCLMDDDVRFDPEILYKTISFLSCIRDEYENISVGGIMLEMERPYKQYEMGGIWTGKQIFNVRSGHDMRSASEVLENETEIPVDYSAWWYMCMPVPFVEAKGLPLPLFIKGDDIDYGMRAAEGIVLMNGIAVWHEGFGGKYNGALEYYIKRNELILNSLHKPSFGLFRNLVKLLSSCVKQIVFQRYSTVDFIIRAYEDFLKGSDFLLRTDGDRLNSELMGGNIPILDDEALAARLKADYPGIRFQPVPGKKPSRLCRFLTLYSYLIPTRFYGETRAYRIIETTALSPVDFFKAKCVIQYNGDTHKGFITTIDKFEAARFGFRFLKISVKMLLRYKKAVKSYQENWRELACMKSWIERLGLDPEKYRYPG